MAGPLDKVRALLESMIRSRRKELLDTHASAGRSLGWQPPVDDRTEGDGPLTPMTVVCAWCGDVIVDGLPQAGETHSICADCFDAMLHPRPGSPDGSSSAPRRTHSQYIGHLFDPDR